MAGTILDLKLASERLIIRIPTRQDAQKIYDYELRNKEHFGPWQSTCEEEPETVEQWEESLAYWEKEIIEGRASRFVLTSKEDPKGDILGTCNYNPLFRGPFQACFLGYKLDLSCQGKGLMFEALERTIHFMFNDMNMHRIMAAYVPHNIRSGALLKRLGFSVEGYARDYLIIDGKWQDHVMTALINDKWSGFAKNLNVRSDHI